MLLEDRCGVVVGVGIGGSVAARFATQRGFRTLLLERYKTPEINRDLEPILIL